MQTLWGRFFRGAQLPQLDRVRWNTPDGDFAEAYRGVGDSGKPHLLLFHGLEGGLRSHYVRGILGEAARRRWGATLLLFRSCGEGLNRLPRFYHSGDTGDARLALEHVLEESRGPVVLAGVSLGGNVLLKLLAEESVAVSPEIAGAVGLSVPYDLSRGSRHIQRGFARVYQRHFVRSLRRKALLKSERFTDFPAAASIRAARTLLDFDDVVTAPLHGFVSADDYYTRSSALYVLDRIRVPTLLISAADDPFLPAEVLGSVREAAAANSFLELLFVPAGGHVGFISGVPWRQIYWAEARLFEFLEQRSIEWGRVHSPRIAVTGRVEV